MKAIRILIDLTLSVLIFSSCHSQMKFINLDSRAPVEDLVEENQFEFKIEPSTQVIDQIELDRNYSYLAFQVRQSDGTYLPELKTSDFTVSENNVPLSQFNFFKNTYEYTQAVDIVFTVDVTGSMTSTIESAKAHLINFVYKSRQVGYHTRMCVVTFGDYTIKKCDRFYDNDPKDPTTWKQVEELISEISKLKALSGVNDPGGNDYNENSMRALIDAAASPWQPNNQRFAILVTDDGFLYSPGNSGAVGDLAPKYSEVLKALQDSKMKIFAATPSLAGYNKKFGKELGVVEASGGEWFKFSDLVSGKITLDSILNRILVHVDTTFIIEYTVEDQPGLNPALPIEQRTNQIRLKDAKLGEVVNLTLKSNLPNGRQEYPKTFKLSDKDLNDESLQVEINQKPTKDFELKDKKTLVFKQAPPPKAKIKVSYEIDDPKESIRLEPIRLALNTPLDQVEVILNDFKADKSYYAIEDVEGRYYVLNLLDSIFAPDAPFRVKKMKKLSVKILIKTKK